MTFFRLIGVAGLALLATACKFEIQVPVAGGAVVSENFRCEAGETCLIDVQDAAFDETFSVELAEGYEFAGWLKAAGHFCGDSLEPCQISSTPLVGQLAAFIDADFTLFLVPQFACAGEEGSCSGDVTRTISGQVTDAPVPNAAVTVTVGTQSFQTQADAQGFYSLDVTSSQLDALVRISARGTSQAGQALEFLSLADSFANLADNAELDITNVTTAAYLLAVAANGGQEPATLAELKAAETAVDASALLELAAVIRLIVDNVDYALPEGFEALLDFAADADAVASFIAGVEAGEDADAVDTTEDDILSDESLLPGFVAEQLPGRYFEVPSARPGYLARNGSILEFDTGGNTGRSLSYDSNFGNAQNRSFTWTIVGGRLVIEYDQPLELTSFVFPDESIATPEQLEALERAPSQQVVQNSSVDRVVYTLLTDGALVDLVQVQERTQITYDPVIVDGEEIQLAPRSDLTSSTSGWRPEDTVETVPFTASCGGAGGAVCVPGTWGATMRYSPGSGFSGDFPVADWGEVVTFADNGQATGAISGVVADWSVVDGKLVISYSDGWSQTVTIVDQLGLEYGVFKEFSNGIQRFADYSIYVKADTPLVLSESFLSNADGLFWNSEINSWIPGVLDDSGDPTPNFVFGWSFSESGDPNTGFNERVSGSGDMLTLVQSPITWSLGDNVLEIDRGFDSLRYWLPIAQTSFGGDRQIYVMEYQLSGSTVAIPARLNIERERPRSVDGGDSIGL
jgi:hypothetical protein